jgi:hypothetical protein
MLMRVSFFWFLVATALVQIGAVLGLCVYRCQTDDGLNCSHYDGLSVSYIIDWDKFVYRALVAALLAFSAGANIMMAFFLVYPDYKHPIFIFFRITHVIAYLGIFFVGLFPVGSWNKQHMGAAFALFLFFSIEYVGLLFVPCNAYNLWPSTYRIDFAFAIQILHAIAIPVLAVIYLVTDTGYWEWFSLILIGLYPIWISRDHRDQYLRPMVEEYGLYQPVQRDADDDRVCVPKSLNQVAKVSPGV